MSNTETKIKEMDMTCSMRCVCFVFFVFLMNKPTHINHIVQGQIPTHTHTCEATLSLTLTVDNRVIVLKEK